jgi:hypothetical protein
MPEGIGVGGQVLKSALRYAPDKAGSVIDPCEHTGVGGVTATTKLPPPFGDTRS